MFYLADFGYQEPNEKFWTTLDKKIKENPNYKGYNLAKQENTYSKKKGRPVQNTDKFINIFNPQPSAFRQKLSSRIKDTKLKNSSEYLKQEEEFKKLFISDNLSSSIQSPKLGRKMTYGLAGVGTLGALYGLNKLRKNRQKAN